MAKSYRFNVVILSRHGKFYLDCDDNGKETINVTAKQADKIVAKLRADGFDARADFADGFSANLKK